MLPMARIAVILLSASLFTTACSVVQATRGPESRDLSVLAKGTPRYKVLAELEAPIDTDTMSDGRKYDVFKFRQGQHGAVKAGKALAYGGAAVLTLGLSELVTTPLEGTLGKGAEMQLRIIYDAEDQVEEVEVLQDDRWIPVQRVGAIPLPRRSG